MSWGALLKSIGIQVRTPVLSIEKRYTSSHRNGVFYLHLLKKVKYFAVCRAVGFRTQGLKINPIRLEQAVFT